MIKDSLMMEAESKTQRKTSQYLAPLKHKPTQRGQYDIYPAYPIGDHKIECGYEALIDSMIHHKLVSLDGYSGVFWKDIRTRLETILHARGINACWHPIEAALYPEAQIDKMIAPYLGGDDPIFGRRYPGILTDFYDPARLARFAPDRQCDLNIVYGPGASLAGWDGFLVYLDVPKNEIQFRSRSGSICNLGASQPAAPKVMYKRFYFVEWVVLNRYKASLLPAIDLFIDSQRPEACLLISGDELRYALAEIAHTSFRVRPWFEPGPWGGQWIKGKIPQLAEQVPNYAWSFEFIVPENGLMLESDRYLIELSFDLLMYQEYQQVLGDFSKHFGFEFPIRFDFLDTFDGGNLSVQCHPGPEFIRQHFGENFTQDETYYILDNKPGARVYLGFKEHIDPRQFRQALERSYQQGEPIDVDQFVNSELAHKHDLFLIPNSTIHCSGTDNLVLEISATPYIFTFKMYDWMRLDLEGNPRPLNIERAFENLNFDRKGERVQKELISKPHELERGQDWRILCLPTHKEHFYDIKRVEFDTRIDLRTEGSPQIMSLVEGVSLGVQTKYGQIQRFNYAETFVVPAAAEAFTLFNEGEGTAWVIVASFKPDWFTRPENEWLIAPADMLPLGLPDTD
jgi:mannose-6-phosphate isomerase class I